MCRAIFNRNSIFVRFSFSFSLFFLNFFRQQPTTVVETSFSVVVLNKTLTLSFFCLGIQCSLCIFHATILIFIISFCDWNADTFAHVGNATVAIFISFSFSACDMCSNSISYDIKHRNISFSVYFLCGFCFFS